MKGGRPVTQLVTLSRTTGNKIKNVFIKNENFELKLNLNSTQATHNYFQEHGNRDVEGYCT